MSATSRRAAAAGAVLGTVLGAALLTGCSLTGADAGSDEGAAGTSPTAVVLQDPTSCQLEHRGSPQEPAALLLSCGERAWEVPNPGTKEQGRALAPQGESGWTVTQAIVAEGEGRVWYRDEALTCLATRDLLDTAAETRVRCRPVEATDGPLPTIPGPIPA